MSIAKETNWSEDYILDMPLGKVWAYRHGILRLHDQACYYKATESDRANYSELLFGD